MDGALLQNPEDFKNLWFSLSDDQKKHSLHSKESNRVWPNAFQYTLLESSIAKGVAQEITTFLIEESARLNESDYLCTTFCNVLTTMNKESAQLIWGKLTPGAQAKVKNHNWYYPRNPRPANMWERIKDSKDQDFIGFINSLKDAVPSATQQLPAPTALSNLPAQGTMMLPVEQVTHSTPAETAGSIHLSAFNLW